VDFLRRAATYCNFTALVVSSKTAPNEHEANSLFLWRKMARLAGVEPATFGFGKQCPVLICFENFYICPVNLLRNPRLDPF